MPIIDKISNMGEGRKLKRLEELARLVTTYEPEIEELSDDELRGKTAEFRSRSRTARRSTTCSPRRSRSPARPRGARSASAISTSS